MGCRAQLRQEPLTTFARLKVNPPGYCHQASGEEQIMGFGKGVLLWLLGVPIPIILLLAMCSHHS
jgi:hypothetical protein